MLYRFYSVTKFYNKGALFYFFVSRLLGGLACGWKKKIKNENKKHTEHERVHFLGHTEHERMPTHACVTHVSNNIVQKATIELLHRAKNRYFMYDRSSSQ